MENPEQKLPSESINPSIPIDLGGDLLVEPLAVPHRAVFKDLEYAALKKAFDEYWDKNGETLSKVYRVKSRKKKGGAPGDSARSMLESNLGVKKLYSDVLVKYAVGKIGDVLHISGLELHDFEEGKKPLLMMSFYYLPKMAIGKIDFEVPYPLEDAKEEEEYADYCKYMQEKHRVLASYEGEVLSEDHNIQLDVTASIDGKPHPSESMQSWWVEPKIHPNKLLMKAVLEHKKGDLFEAEWLYEGKVVKAHVKVLDVQTITYPELNDEFAKDLEFDNLEAMKAKFLADYRKHIQDAEDSAMVSGVLNSVILNAAIPPIPAEWVSAKVEAIVKEYSDKMGGMKKVLQALHMPNEKVFLSNCAGQVQGELIQKMAVKAYVEYFGLSGDEESTKKHMRENVKWNRG